MAITSRSAKRAKEALREAKQGAEASKVQYEQIVSMISDIYWRYDINGQGEIIGTYISPVADKLLGLPDGTIGNSFDKYFSYVHPDDLPVVQEILSEVIRMLGKDATAEYRLFKADGTTLWVQSRGSACSQADGRVAVFGTTRDITERKHAEMALRESEERYRAFFRTSRDCVYITSVDGRWVDLNDAAVQFFGYDSREDLLKVEIKDLYANPEERTRHLQVINEKGISQEYPVILRKKDGTLIDTLITSVTRKDSTGRIIGYQGTIRDITEPKRAEEELQESEERFKAQYQSSPTPTFTWQKHGADFVLVDFNEAAKAITDGKVREFVVRKASDLYADRQEILRDLLRCHEEREVIRREIRSQNFVPGALVVATFASVPPDLVLVHLEDITDRKRAEEELKENEEKYRNLVERANDGITIIQDGTVRYANPAIAEIWGGSIEKIVGRPFTDFIDPDEIPKVVERYQRRMANEFVTPMIYETILRRRDGTKIFAELNAGLITFQGTPADLVIIRDITDRKVVEERLFSLLRFQNEMLDTASIWIDMFDARGKTTFWNLAAERISGYSREEVLGHAKIWKWLYPDPEYRAKMIDNVTKILLNNERVENFETIIRLKDGGQRVISWHSSNFVDKDGKISGGIGIGVDITEKREAENELRESQRRLADIIDFLPDATMVIDKDSKIISWNKAIEDMTGVKAEDILGKGDYEYAIPFYGQRRPILINMVQKPLKELEINYSNIKRQGGVLVGEAFMPNLKGGEAYLLGTAAALYDSGGNIVGAIESIRDITDHKRAEEAFKAERDRAEQYLNTVEVILVALDTEARITLLNRKGYQVLGYEEGELMGRDWIKTCLHAQDHESVYEANREIVAGKYYLSIMKVIFSTKMAKSVS